MLVSVSLVPCCSSRSLPPAWEMPPVGERRGRSKLGWRRRLGLRSKCGFATSCDLLLQETTCHSLFNKDLRRLFVRSIWYSFSPLYLVHLCSRFVQPFRFPHFLLACYSHHHLVHSSAFFWR